MLMANFKNNFFFNLLFVFLFINNYLKKYHYNIIRRNYIKNYTY